MSTPEPPASNWFARMVRAQRMLLGARQSPQPAAWERRMARPWSLWASSSAASPRLAPTPVLRPYSGRTRAIRSAASCASMARSRADSSTKTLAPEEIWLNEGNVSVRPSIVTGR